MPSPGLMPRDLPLLNLVPFERPEPETQRNLKGFSRASH